MHTTSTISASARTLLALACASAVACTSDDDTGVAGCANGDVVRTLPGRYTGTIEDQGGDVPCRYAGESFELALELDDAMCVDAAFCPNGEFWCALSGDLMVAGEPRGELSGEARLQGRRSAGVTVELSLTTPDGGGPEGRAFYLEGPRASRSLGGVGGQARWRWRHDGPDAGVEQDWEECTVTIATIPSPES